MFWPTQSLLAHIKKVTGSARQAITFLLPNSDLKATSGDGIAALLPPRNNTTSSAAAL
jgi:hypothetical protein